MIGIRGVIGIGALAMLVGGSAALAGPVGAPAKREAGREAARDVGQTGTVSRAAAAPAATEADDDPLPEGCTRARRRLWVDGEGWLVRRVTTCR